LPPNSIIQKALKLRYNGRRHKGTSWRGWIADIPKQTPLSRHNIQRFHVRSISTLRRHAPWDTRENKWKKNICTFYYLSLWSTLMLPALTCKVHKDPTGLPFISMLVTKVSVWQCTSTTVSLTLIIRWCWHCNSLLFWIVLKRIVRFCRSSVEVVERLTLIVINDVKLHVKIKTLMTHFRDRH
jgi:hypothetical protein